MSASHAVDVLQFSRAARTVGLDAHESAMRFDIGVRTIFEPTQGVCSTGEIGVRRLYARIFPKPFVQPFSESAQSQGVSEDQDGDAFGRRGALAKCARRSFPWLRLREDFGCCKRGHDQERATTSEPRVRQLFKFPFSVWRRGITESLSNESRLTSRPKERRVKPPSFLVWRLQNRHSLLF